MSYKISIPKSKKYILCSIKKNITADFSRKFMLEAEVLGIEHNILNFLYDSRNCRNVEKVHRTYHYIYKDMKILEFTRAARVAMLVSSDDNSHDFVEVVCRNAGYNVKLFRNKNKAVKWLEENEIAERYRKKTEIEIENN